MFFFFSVGPVDPFDDLQSIQSQSPDFRRIFMPFFLFNRRIAWIVFLIALAYAVLGLLGALVVKPELAQALGCRVHLSLRAQALSVEQMKRLYQKDQFFWAWMSSEGFQPQSLESKIRSSCPEGEASGEIPEWKLDERWAILFPNLFQTFNSQMHEIQEADKIIKERLQNFQRRREEWWPPIENDLKKICSLKLQVERLKQVRSHMTSACQALAPQNLLRRCRKEIRNMDLLILREEKPWVENKEKMKSKWPYLSNAIETAALGCHGS